jgi:hypothetical protein
VLWPRLCTCLLWRDRGLACVEHARSVMSVRAKQTVERQRKNVKAQSSSTVVLVFGRLRIADASADDNHR